MLSDARVTANIDRIRLFIKLSSGVFLSQICCLERWRRFRLFSMASLNYFESGAKTMSHCVQEPILTEDKQIQELITRARAAQAIFELFSQEQVDAIVKGIGKYVYDNAEPLARMAVDETGIGVYEDKILKNKGKARVIWNNLKDKPSRGIIGEDEETNMVFVAKPMGVVAAVTPVTNPVVTPMCN